MASNRDTFPEIAKVVDELKQFNPKVEYCEENGISAGKKVKYKLLWKSINGIRWVKCQI